MTDKTEIFKCGICGKAVEIIHCGEGELVCCGKPMMHLKANTDDSASQEKHVPVLEGSAIKVGSILHPMTEEHHIEFIEALSLDKKYMLRKFLEPGEEPVLNISCGWEKDVFMMREWCNLHGVWTAEKK